MGQSEECDDGPNNGPGQACNALHGNVCGDGDQGPGEECDNGAMNGDMNGCKVGLHQQRVRRRGGRAGRGLRRRQPERQRRVYERVRAGELRRRRGRADRGVRRRQRRTTRRVHRRRARTRLRRRVRAAGNEACDEGATTRTTRRARCSARRTCAATGSCSTRAAGTRSATTGADNGPGKACNAMCKLNVCGDGDKGPDEQCDDGELDGGDGCSASCTLEECGNSVVDPGEACDDGANGDQDDGCTDACKSPVCGDSFVQPSIGEECDLGGANSNTGRARWDVQGGGVRRRADPGERRAVRRRGQQRQRARRARRCAR
jgi:cysteine-rich repeat protein